MRAGHDTGAASRTRLADALARGTTRERVVALRGLARRDELDDAHWCALVADADPAVRREAREQAAHRAPRVASVRDALVHGLADDDPLAVDAAAFALGEFGDGSAVGPLSR
ncbi:MAG: hypothetical protein ACYCRG_10030, partial [Acidimicrobiales bacterium]